MYYNGVGYGCAQPCVPVVPVAGYGGGCGGGCGFGGCCCAFILVLLSKHSLLWLLVCMLTFLYHNRFQ